MNLCVVCKGKGLCGLKKCPILESFKVKIPKKEISSNSPPSFFVSRGENVFLSTLSFQSSFPLFYDLPELWKNKTQEEIISFRSKLVLLKDQEDLERKQEILLSKEVYTYYKIKNLKRSLTFSSVSPIHGPFAKIEYLETSISGTYKPLEKVYYDEMKADEAIFYLYKKGFYSSRIPLPLSLGMLGLKRKIVPSRNSITAVDSILSKKNLEKVKTFKELDVYLVFSSSLYNNRFFVIFFPGSWEFEQIERWKEGHIWGGKEVVVSDYEGFKGRKSYAENVEGAYYASRLAVSEYLLKVKRQAKVLVIREINPSYRIPLGVWQIRENVRNALKKKPMNFSTDKELFSYLSGFIDLNFYRKRSNILKNVIYQKKLSDFC